jgi:hypothetical protein
LAEVIWGGSWVIGVSSIFSETFGKVAHPLQRLTVDTNRNNKKNGLTIMIWNFIKKHHRGYYGTNYSIFQLELWVAATLSKYQKTARLNMLTVRGTTPKDMVVLTLACGKFRFFDKELGNICGIPRLLDIGQWNDTYSATQIAIALSKAFNMSVNDPVFS